MQVFETREDMINILVEKFLNYVEVGIFEGKFSEYIANTLHPYKFALIDIFQGVTGSGDQDGNNFKYIQLENTYNTWKGYEKMFPNNISVLKGLSHNILPTLEDDYYTMIYLDADHSYEGTLRDLKLSYPKVKHGGWIMGHDYEMNMKKAKQSYSFGVKQAVDEFCKEYDQEIYAKAYDGCVSFAIRVDKLHLDKENTSVV
jgi:hypothetical protein